MPGFEEMVYYGAARKTGAYIVLAGVLSMGILTFTSGSLDPTGRVTSPGVLVEQTGAGWIIFALGVFLGAIIVGTYAYIAHIEAKREE